jgi:hypothetical protein
MPSLARQGKAPADGPHPPAGDQVGSVTDHHHDGTRGQYREDDHC